MARFVFKYTTSSVNPTEAFPARHFTIRPYLAVSLFHGSASFPCYGLIDSGADDCIFPASFASRLGLDLRSGKSYRFGGVASPGQEAHFFDVEMVIADVIRHKLAIGFTAS